MNQVIQVQPDEGTAYAIFNTTKALYYNTCYKYKEVAEAMSIRVTPAAGTWVSSRNNLVYSDSTDPNQ